MRPVAAIAVLAVWLAGCDSTEDAAPPLPAPARISEAGVSEHLEALQHIADQNDGNRAAGTPGYDESADYVAARLRAAGWHVERQSFAFPYFEERSASVTAGSVLRPDRDFRVVTYSGSGRATAPLADAGRACSGPELEGVRAAVAIARPGGC
ncbi:MAG: amidohydrolase, partial [Thermoleophilaceae bacterium]|nr:amidohydrolase [Thermoleophilaceae bacterium]